MSSVSPSSHQVPATHPPTFLSPGEIYQAYRISAKCSDMILCGMASGSTRREVSPRCLGSRLSRGWKTLYYTLSFDDMPLHQGGFKVKHMTPNCNIPLQQEEACAWAFRTGLIEYKWLSFKPAKKIPKIVKLGSTYANDSRPVASSHRIVCIVF